MGLGGGRVRVEIEVWVVDPHPIFMFFPLLLNLLPYPIKFVSIKNGCTVPKTRSEAGFSLAV